MMVGDIEPGMECYLEDNFSVGGEPAFQKDELVKVHAVDPDKERPAFKYLVHSERLNKDVRLRTFDLRPKYCPKCGNELDYFLTKCESCGWQIPERKSPVERGYYDGRGRFNKWIDS